MPRSDPVTASAVFCWEEFESAESKSEGSVTFETSAWEQDSGESGTPPDPACRDDAQEDLVRFICVSDYYFMEFWKNRLPCPVVEGICRREFLTFCAQPEEVCPCK